MPIPAAYGSSRQQKKKQRPFPTYAGTPYSFTQGTSVTITPTIKGDGPSSASISPALPSGLSLNATTLVISGTPSESSSQTTYTVTATNDGGQTAVQLQLTITAAAPTVTITSMEYTTLSYGNNGSNTPDPSLVLSETLTSSGGEFTTEKIGQYFSAANAQKVLTQGTVGYSTTNLSANDLPADGSCAIAVDIAWQQGLKTPSIWIWRPDSGEDGSPLETAEPGQFTAMAFSNLTRDEILNGRIDLMPSASTGFAHYVPAASGDLLILAYRVNILLANGNIINSEIFSVRFNEEGQVPAFKQYLQAAAPPTISNVTLLAFAYAPDGNPGVSAPLDPSQQETVTISASSGTGWQIEPDQVALFKDSNMEKLYYAWSVTYDSSALNPTEFSENDVIVNFTVNNPAGSNKMQYHRNEFADDVLFGTPSILASEYSERAFCIDGETAAFLLPGFGGVADQPRGAPGDGPYAEDNPIIFNASEEGAPEVAYEFSLTFIKQDGNEIVTDPVTVLVPPNATRNFL